MSMFLVEGSSQRSCNLASECTHECWLVWVGVCVCVRSCVLVGMCRQRCALIVARCACTCACMSARVNACSSSTAGLDLTASSGHHRARAPTSRPRLARCCRQRPLEYALATVSRPSRPKVTTLPRRTAERAPLRPKPSRARLCHGFAALETKCDDPSASKSARYRELSRLRPCHGFAPRETKSDDPSAQNRAATAKAL